MIRRSTYERSYSERSFRNTLSRYARTAGREVVEKALLLYYALQEDATPAWAKTAIIGALGYLITLVDAVPDVTPALGYTDDLGVLLAALAVVSSYINDDVRARARRTLDRWFGAGEPLAKFPG